MEVEVSAQVGAERGERAPERRVTHRNGYRPREWDTRVGTVELQVPRLRAGSFFSSILEPRRAERALASVVMTCSEVSRICGELDELVAAWRNRPLDTGPYPLAWMDALSMRCARAGGSARPRCWWPPRSTPMGSRLARLVASLAPATAPSRGSGQVGCDRARLQHMSGSRARPAGQARRQHLERGGRSAPHRARRGMRAGSSPRRRSRNAAPTPLRLLGLDLGVTSEHAAVVLDVTGSVCARRRARPTVDSLAALEAAALAGAEPATQLVVVIEPTGPAWLPIAVFFGRRGHTVLRVTSAKAADLRRFLARHAKSNGIDAETLARLPLVAPSGLTAVEFGTHAWASLDRRVRAVARLTAEVGRRKTRIRALVQALIPTIATALSDDGLNQTDLAILERYADPRALLAAGPARLTRLITKTSRGLLGAAKTEALRVAAAEAVALWEDDAPSRSRTWPPRSPPRSACCAPPKPSGPGTSTPGRLPWAVSTPPDWRPPATPRSWRRRAAGGRDGPARAVPQRRRVQGLHRAHAQSQRDRPDRPQAPAHDQGRPAGVAQPAHPVRQHRSQARSPARRRLPRPDDRARREPSQGAVRGGRSAGRTRLADHGPW
jgi:hypothetical protein